MRARTLSRDACAAGSTLVEFALVLFQLMLVLLAGIEFARMVVVYTSLVDAANMGTRYAIVHGSQNTGSTAPVPGVDPGSRPSGPGNNPVDVVNTIKYWKTGLDPAKLNVSVTYANGSNDPGSIVTVKVWYLYEPFTLLPIKNMKIGAVSAGVIMY
jgi:hypothetical protein